LAASFIFNQVCDVANDPTGTSATQLVGIWRTLIPPSSSALRVSGGPMSISELLSIILLSIGDFAAIKLIQK
jgi:hypothetical protein